MSEQHTYVDWFRKSAPYINAHRGQTFVVQFGGEAALDAAFPGFIHDIALLHSLGVRLVLVHGARPQIEQRLMGRSHAVRYAAGLRITDEAALSVVKEACGYVRLEIEALLSMGLANSPMAGADIRVTSGNFVTARPIGVRDGIDFEHTGEVRRVDGEALRRQLEHGSVVLLSPVGFSPTGECFNLSAEDVATAVAIELHAAKLLLLGEREGVHDQHGTMMRHLTMDEARSLLAQRRRSGESPDGEGVRHLGAAVHACRNGVRRVHLVDRHVDGGVLLELFTRDGVGTMVSADNYERTRPATIDDVGGILELIAPLEEEGILVRRSREKLEPEIGHFLVMERDGAIIGCAAAYPFPGETMAELACLAVHDEYRDARRGDMLLDAVEGAARAGGAERLFVLTTRTVHWFKERGFLSATLDELPADRQSMYNYQRNSKVLIKPL